MQFKTVRALKGGGYRVQLSFSQHGQRKQYHCRDWKFLVAMEMEDDVATGDYWKIPMRELASRNFVCNRKLPMWPTFVSNSNRSNGLREKVLHLHKPKGTTYNEDTDDWSARWLVQRTPQ